MLYQPPVYVGNTVNRDAIPLIHQISAVCSIYHSLYF